MARQASVPVGACSTTRWSSWSSNMFEDQLLHRVVEHAPTGTDACLAISTEQFSERPTGKVRAIRDSYPWSECLVIGLGQPVRHALVAGHDQAGRFDSCVGARAYTKIGLLIGGQLTRIDRRVLTRPVGLHVMQNVGQWSVEFPPEAVVQGKGRADLPTVLCEQIETRGSDILALPRTLRVAVRQSKQITGIVGVLAVRVLCDDRVLRRAVK